jgi:hypothetical protein
MIIIDDDVLYCNFKTMGTTSACRTYTYMGLTFNLDKYMYIHTHTYTYVSTQCHHMLIILNYYYCYYYTCKKYNGYRTVVHTDVHICILCTYSTWQGFNN